MNEVIRKVFLAWLVMVPVALIAKYAGASETQVFFLAALAIVPLAMFLGEATESLAARSGAGLGGLLNATFGNATELIIAFFALKAGLIEVVKASLIGSIIGNLLLVLGMSILLGGLRRNNQKFNRTAALANASMLFLAVIAIAVPTIFVLAIPNVDHATSKSLSVTVAVLMFLTYIANLLFVFKTHHNLYAEEAGQFESRWTTRKGLAILALTTIGVAWLSQILVDSIEPALGSLGWTELFVGTVVIAIIGNAAEHVSAIVVAVKNRMDLSLQIAIGSASQIAMLVMPLLVFAGLLLHRDMNLIFGTFELAVLVVSVVITNIVVQDGESNWFEGAQLLAAYGIIAVAFFLHP